MDECFQWIHCTKWFGYDVSAKQKQFGHSFFSKKKYELNLQGGSDIRVKCCMPLVFLAIPVSPVLDLIYSLACYCLFQGVPTTQISIAHNQDYASLGNCIS